MCEVFAIATLCNDLNVEFIWFPAQCVASVSICVCVCVCVGMKILPRVIGAVIEHVCKHTWCMMANMVNMQSKYFMSNFLDDTMTIWHVSTPS